MSRTRKAIAEGLFSTCGLAGSLTDDLQDSKLLNETMSDREFLKQLSEKMRKLGITKSRRQIMQESYNAINARCRWRDRNPIALYLEHKDLLDASYAADYVLTEDERRGLI